MLADLQRMLAGIYGIDLDADVRDYLVTDPGLIDDWECGQGRPTEEKLLVRQSQDVLNLALYLSADLLARLERSDPLASLQDSNLGDFCLALEGVSHFNYMVWNASADRCVTLLELEMQAEIDKYVAARILMARQRRQAGLHRLLEKFLAEPRFLPQLDADEQQRYRHAARYAGYYCRSLATRYQRAHPDREMTRELRHFYRLPQPAKLSHIHSAAFA